MTTNAIRVSYPEAAKLHLQIAVGACKLQLSAGEQTDWVTGAYDDPFDTLPCKVEQNGGVVKISQEFAGARWLEMGKGHIPQLKLVLGKVKPFTLTLEVGASESEFELGGLPLQQLQIQQGAGKFAFNFAAPNPQPMSLLKVEAGAGSVEMKQLANANFAEMTVDGGAAAFQLNFGGALQRPAFVRINTGLAAVEIEVPEGVAAKIASESFIGGLDVGNGFTKREDAFWTDAAMHGATPLLSIATKVALGSLKLRVD
ncbi:MAG: hypothetical protein DYG89_37865 [Caldilinea sp. CFX5]|nr:hypothetical protein [Caldilinea sp. CFX5]